MDNCEVLRSENAKIFVGQILETKDDNYFTITFLKGVEFGKFVWHDTDDIAYLNRSCVVNILPEPQVGRRSRMTFN